MPQEQRDRPSVRSLPRNVWAVSLTSFFMDISSEMVINLLPLFLSGVLGVKTNVIGLIEGIAEATASLLKVFSGWLSDKLRSRKWLAVVGYGISALSKPFFYWANTWGAVAGVRWADRVGKGVRTAPRDALVADSIDEKQRGLAFGLHRAADTGGAVLGLIISLLVVWWMQAGRQRGAQNADVSRAGADQPGPGGTGCALAGPRRAGCCRDQAARGAAIRLSIARQAVHGLYDHRRAV